MLRFRLPLPCLNSILPHGERPVYPVQFVVEATGVTHGLAVIVASPERGLRGAAVGAAETQPPRGRGEHGLHRTLEVNLNYWTNFNAFVHQKDLSI